MLKKINRVFQDYMREKRLKLGKYIWDKKKNKEEIKSGNFIENNDIKKILFMRYDGKIGDMVINTLMFREIKKKYPYIEIGVVTKEGAKVVIENNPNVDKIYEYKKDRKSIKELSLKIASEKYDLLIDFSEMLRVNQMMLINLCKARFNIGIDREEWELFDITIKSGIDFNWTDHITERYSAYLKKIGFKENEIDKKYDIYIAETDKYKEFLNKILKGKLSHLQLHKILGITTIILGTIHGLGMAFAYPSVLKKYTGISGIFLLSLFWILGTLPFIVKKVPIKYKKNVLKSHKILGGIIFIFIIIHISL